MQLSHFDGNQTNIGLFSYFTFRKTSVSSITLYRLKMTTSKENHPEFLKITKKLWL